MRSLSLNYKIFLGVVLGLSLGVVINFVGAEKVVSQRTLYVADLVGALFINLLKMILIPLVFTSISVGVSNLADHSQMKKIWKVTLAYFFSTTALSVCLGLVVVNIFKPGVNLQIDILSEAMETLPVQQMTLPEFIRSFLNAIFINPFQALANGKVLPTVIFAIFSGVAMIIAGDKAGAVRNFLNQAFLLIMIMVDWIMKISPYGIAALLLKLAATQNVSLLLELGLFIGVVLGATLFHGLITLPSLLMIFGRISPVRFFFAMQKALITAFSTSSSSVTLPLTIECVEDNLQIDKNVARFVLPLGATINMDGTALYEAIAALFIANVIGIELNLVQQLIVFFMAIIAAIGAPGIPSAGMVTMVMVLQSVGLPAEAIAILLPIDRVLDAVRTTVNVEGDAVGSCIVHRLINNN